MAERRMVSKKIVDSDAFMDMALSTQALYFHLLARADDDGFVGNPKKIMRMVGAGDDEYKVLIAKRFILQFPSGVCVIKHWLIHNLIRNDRYNETQYLEEKKSLEVKENKAYTEVATIGIPDGNQMEPQVRLGKVRLGKVSKEDISDKEKLFQEFWLEYPNRKIDKKDCLSFFLKQDVELCKKIVDDVKKRKVTTEWLKERGQFVPSTIRYLKKGKWDDMMVEREIINLDYRTK